MSTITAKLNVTTTNSEVISEVNSYLSQYALAFGALPMSAIRLVIEDRH